MVFKPEVGWLVGWFGCVLFMEHVLFCLPVIAWVCGYQRCARVLLNWLLIFTCSQKMNLPSKNICFAWFVHVYSGDEIKCCSFVCFVFKMPATKISEKKMLNMSVLSLIHSSNFCFVTSVSLHKHLVRETFFDMANENPVIALISCVKCFHKCYTWMWREGTLCVIHIFMFSLSLKLMNVERYACFFSPHRNLKQILGHLSLRMCITMWQPFIFPFIPENDKPMKGLRQEDMVNQDLITELRKEFSMTHDDFYMVLTDADMRVKVRSSSLSKWGGCCSESIKNVLIVGSKWVFIGHKPLLCQACQGCLFYWSNGILSLN